MPARTEAAAPPWHALDAAEVAARLQSDARHGLTRAEAERRLARDGPNRLPETPPRAAWRMFLDQFASLLVAVLAVAMLLALLVGEVADAAAIAAILLLNAVLGFAQERGAANALAALRRLAAPSARVVRDGEQALVPAAGLVAGDLVRLEAGDAVPADVRLVVASGLRVVEASLTGEAEPVPKQAAKAVAADAVLAERGTMAYQGTTAVAGEALALVVGTGARTELGRVAALVEGERALATPLQTRLAAFGRLLVVGAGVAVVLVLVLGLLRGHPWDVMFLTAVGLAVAAVPEGLPAVVTVALALGVARMARRGALVRRLSAVETLGSTTVICTDKTGTLTEGSMRAAALATLEDEREVRGAGYAPASAFLEGGEPRAVSPDEPLHALLWGAVAGSTARLEAAPEGVRVLGDPTEGALLAAAAGAGIEARQVEAREPAVGSRPFEAARKRMTVLRARDGGTRAYVKGAPEAVLPLSTRVAAAAGDVPLGAAQRARFEGWNAAQAGLARRVLAVARRDGPRGALAGDGGEQDPEAGLTLLGLVALVDPPRPAAREAVAACKRAGVRVVMITGDQPATALAVARDLGIADAPDEVAHGRDLEVWSDAQLEAHVERVRVYARAAPEHKLRIVKAWRARGQVVAMTGDGVNDAPALKGADIGVAMGRSGTDVAKDASAMVLLDDDFATLVEAVQAGRRIYENVRKSLLYLLSGNAGEILVMTVSVAAGLPLPLLPIQLLWINLVTDGLPALALATDPGDPDLLMRPPRRPDEPLADRAFLQTLSASALLAAAATLGAFLWALAHGADEATARTAAFTTLVFEELLRAFVVRSRTRIVWEVGLLSNRRLAVVALASVALQVALLRAEPLARWFGAVTLPWEQIAALGAVAAIPATVLELYKLARRARARV